MFIQPHVYTTQKPFEVDRFLVPDTNGTHADTPLCFNRLENLVLHRSLYPSPRVKRRTICPQQVFLPIQSAGLSYWVRKTKTPQQLHHPASFPGGADGRHNKCGVGSLLGGLARSCQALYGAGWVAAVNGPLPVAGGGQSYTWESVSAGSHCHGKRGVEWKRMGRTHI